MTRHTPGQWKYLQANNKGDRQGEDCLIYTNDNNNNKLHIAETFQYQNAQNNSNNGVSIANAKLIASAPDLLRQRDELLEELKNVVGWYESWIKSDFPAEIGDPNIAGIKRLIEDCEAE